GPLRLRDQLGRVQLFLVRRDRRNRRRHGGTPARGALVPLRSGGPGVVAHPGRAAPPRGPEVSEGRGGGELRGHGDPPVRAAGRRVHGARKFLRVAVAGRWAAMATGRFVPPAVLQLLIWGSAGVVIGAILAVIVGGFRMIKNTVTRWYHGGLLLDLVAGLNEL